MTPDEIGHHSDRAMQTTGRVMALMMDDKNEEAFMVVEAIDEPLERTFVTLYAAALAATLTAVNAEDLGVNGDEHLLSMLDVLRASMPISRGSEA